MDTRVSLRYGATASLVENIRCPECTSCRSAGVIVDPEFFVVIVSEK